MATVFVVAMSSLGEVEPFTLAVEPFSDVPDDWPLSHRQLKWLSCETLLLCLPVEPQQLSEREAKALGHTLASQLGPEHTAAALTSSLRLEGHDDPQAMQELQPFLHFRLLLLIYKRPGAFPSPGAFQAWAERQLSVVYNGLVGVLRRRAATPSPSTLHPPFFWPSPLTCARHAQLG